MLSNSTLTLTDRTHNHLRKTFIWTMRPCDLPNAMECYQTLTLTNLRIICTFSSHIFISCYILPHFCGSLTLLHAASKHQNLQRCLLDWSLNISNFCLIDLQTFQCLIFQHYSCMRVQRAVWGIFQKIASLKDNYFKLDLLPNEYFSLTSQGFTKVNEAILCGVVWNLLSHQIKFILEIAMRYSAWHLFCIKGNSFSGTA